MLFLLILSILPSTVRQASGELDPMCNDNCKCCKDEICRQGTNGWTNVCTMGCIDGHRGARCYEKCLYENCRRCGFDAENRTCSDCYDGYYLGPKKDCTLSCPSNCKSCTSRTYCTECKEGFYNENGSTTCPYARCPANCECKPGHYDCVSCKKGFYDTFIACKKKCPVNCLSCESDVLCNECKTGFYNGFEYDNNEQNRLNCDKPCSQYCANNTCNRVTGKCIHGCTSGYSGDRCCVMSENCVECNTDIECKVCLPGYFRNSCNDTCPGGCRGSCDISTGECILNGQTGEPSSPIGPVAGGMAALVLVAGILVSIVFLKRRCRHMKKDSSNESIVKGALSSSGSGDCIETVQDGPVYANIQDTPVPETDVEGVVLDELNDTAADDKTDYHTVKVEDLFSYVTKDHIDCFESEFKNLPKHDNLSTLCKVAKREENIASNRYNGIYPFDHSRVTIPGEPKFYINACYIDGYTKRKTYIASCGPTSKHTKKFKTFWQMVWHEKSDIIVMLTNLHEATGMKCDQYWPNEEREECYGMVKVKCRSVEEFAEYTVRSFTVSKGREQRSLAQVHFTAWPDKGVPSEVTSLVEFRQKVKTAPVVLGGPVIVHCSAGVGRTGTFIAFDILSAQGKAERLVNVFNCVKNLREQRVNMVQTTEQYIFLHKALVHTLTFGCEAQTAEEIQCLPFDDDVMFTNMFQKLNQDVDNEREIDIAAREENKRKYADKSRCHSDIPGNLGRVHLFLQRRAGDHDFINAIFINSFKIKSLFIAAQTPQLGTVEDFLCMIYQQNTGCVINLDDPLQLSKEHDVGKYLPVDNEEYTCGEFIVTSSKYETKPQYTVKKINIKHTTKGEEKISYHFQYTKWENSRKVPDSHRNFVQFIKDVEKYVNKRGADMPNVAVHCLNGAERSGLFCVVYTLLEKIGAERQVSVVNVIRKVRAQRKLSIPSVDQLKFCYQCVSGYLESYSTYSNFAT